MANEQLTVHEIHISQEEYESDRGKYIMIAANGCPVVVEGKFGTISMGVPARTEQEKEIARESCRKRDLEIEAVELDPNFDYSRFE